MKGDTFENVRSSLRWFLWPRLGLLRIRIHVGEDHKTFFHLVIWEFAVGISFPGFVHRWIEKVSKRKVPVDKIVKTEIVGGFSIHSDNCAGCGLPLLIENAWMTDGCPCNSINGINCMNPTRWRLLVELQQQQSRELESLRKFKTYVHKRLDDAGVPVDPESTHKAEGCRIGGRLDIVLSYRFAPTPGEKFSSGFGVGASIRSAIAEQYNTKTAKARAVLRTIGTKGYPSITVGELSEALAELEVQS